MPIIGAHVLLALLCGVHAVRTGRGQPWLYIIVLAPFLGSVVYIFVEVLPELSHSRAARQVKTDVSKLVNPNKSYRDSYREAELVGSADSFRALAEESAKKGNYQDAIHLYKEALSGAHSDDPVLKLGLARMHFAAGEFGEVVQDLDELRESNPTYQSSDAHLLYTRSLENLGQTDRALEEYDALAVYFPGEEARCRYAQLLAATGNASKAREQFSMVEKSVRTASKIYFRSQKEWYNIARNNLGA